MKNLYKKIIVLIILVGFIAAFRILDLSHYLTFSYMKTSHHKLEVLYDENPAVVVSGYFLIYILAASLSIPGAEVLSIAGGALFGLATGTLIVSFASSIGAAMGCLMSRFLLRDAVASWFGDRIALMNERIEKEGAFYLFALRLIPVIPYMVVNLLMGLTRMPIFTFYWISQLGMLPATVLYVNAGRELARIESPSEILSLRVLFSFALLGLFPLIVKKLLSFYGLRKDKQQAG